MATAEATKTAVSSQPTKPHVGFTARRLFSLIGLVPLGIYTVVHLMNVSRWWGGPEGYDQIIAAAHGSWFSIIGSLLLLAFVAYHAVVGLRLMFTARPVSPKPKTQAHWQYILQRVSAIGILLFIPAHVIKAKLLPAMAGTHETFAGMHHAFAQDPMRFLTIGVYVLGTAGVAYHLANGIWTSAVTFGFAQGPKAQRTLQAFCALFCLGLIALAYGTIYVLIRG